MITEVVRQVMFFFFLTGTGFIKKKLADLRYNILFSHV